MFENQHNAIKKKIVSSAKKLFWPGPCKAFEDYSETIPMLGKSS